MTKHNQILIGKGTAVISFVIGTLIFLLYVYNMDSNFLFLGYGFILVSGIINIIILIQLGFFILFDKENRKAAFKAIGLIFCNVPFLILYIWITLILINTVRITFINETPVTLYNIKIDGCENTNIEKLINGESQTVWISIPHDCSVSISYKIYGMNKWEEVTGYVTIDGGYKMTYRIGTNQVPYDQEL